MPGRIPLDVELNRLARQIQWQDGTHDKFLAALQGDTDKTLIAPGFPIH